MDENVKCTKPNCNCIEIAELNNGGEPVKSYQCLAPVGKNFLKKQELNNDKLKAFCQHDVSGCKEFLIQLRSKIEKAIDKAEYNDDDEKYLMLDQLTDVYAVIRLLKNLPPYSR